MPKPGDLILFVIESEQWAAAKYPMLSQVLYADNFDDIKQKALQYAVGRNISVWQEIDANTDEYLKC